MSVMKKLKCFLFVAALALMVSGCRKPVEVSFAVATQEFEAQGGTAEIGLKSNGDWTIELTADWISVNPVYGSGDATLTLTVLPNTASESRTAEIKATTADNAAVLTVTQSFTSYYININPNQYECLEDGGEFDLQVSSNIDWAVSNLPNWIELSETSGSGDGQIRVTVGVIQSEVMEYREADVIFGNDKASTTLHVVQGLTQPIYITVMPELLVMASSGETKTFVLNCEGSWTASAENEWIMIDKTEGEGNAEVAVTVDENPLYELRRGTVKLTSSTGNIKIVNVIQEASIDPHFLEVSPTNFSFGKEGGTEQITIGCDMDWMAEIQSSWVSLSATSGSGNGTIMITVAHNPIEEPRELNFVIVSGQLRQRLSVTQEAGDAPINASFTPDTLFPAYVGGTQQLELAVNTTWVLEPSDDWIILNSNASGEGDATVRLIIDLNVQETPRTGYLNVVHNGQLIGRAVIVQEGWPNIFETNVTEIEARPEGGEYIVHVTANQSWATSIDVGWITCTPTSGNGDGDITLMVTPIPVIQTRIGHVVLKGSTGREITITVTQHQ